MRLRQKQGYEIQDEDKRKEHFRWTLFDGESRRRINNMLALAKAIRPISDNGEDWDSDPWLLGVENGVLNLRTGRLRAGRPKDRITMSTGVPYDPSATCPLWERTVSEIFGRDRELIDYVQRALGYSLSGVTNQQCFFMTWGSGANGKGTLINTVARVLGDYADDLPFSALELQQRASIPNDVAKLVGKRFVTSSETSDDIRLNEARVKALTGCDPITARFLHREFFTFQPAAKFWLATNHKPVVQDDSDGFWRRIRLIPFTQQFKDARDDKNLKDKLKAEAPGILRWLVEGCKAWQGKGLNPPQVVKQATNEYEAESDPLTPFFEERCALGASQRVRAQRFYQEYRTWCCEGGIDPLNLKRFGQQVRKRFHADEHNHVVTYLGVGLRDSGIDPSTHPDPFSASSSQGTGIGQETGKRVRKGRIGQCRRTQRGSLRTVSGARTAAQCP
jgi:putative DNA primase/helicase